MHLLQRLLAPVSLLLAVFAAPLAAEPADAALQAKLDAKIAEVKTWATDPVIISAVVAQNTELPATHAAITQEKWKSFTVLDPFVRSFSRNPAGVALKARKADWVAEAFLNDSEGRKVAFLNKTTSWSHGSSAKHSDPLAGKSWQGNVEIDESSGLQQIQIAVPVLSGGTPVGSLIVGVALSKLD